MARRNDLPPEKSDSDKPHGSAAATELKTPRQTRVREDPGSNHQGQPQSCTKAQGTPGTKRKVRVLPKVNSLATQDHTGSPFIRTAPSTIKKDTLDFQRKTPTRRAKVNISYRAPSPVVRDDSDSSVAEETTWCEGGSSASEGEMTSDSDVEDSIITTLPQLKTAPAGLLDRGRQTLRGFKDETKHHTPRNSGPNDLDEFASRPSQHPLQPNPLKDGSTGAAEGFRLPSTAILLPEPSRPSTPTGRPTTPPSSPSKSCLQSPSKRHGRIPTPPGRPSLDTFWDAVQVTSWTDTHSPQKRLLSPTKSRFLQSLATKHDSSNTLSISPPSSPSKPSPTKHLTSPKKSKSEVEARRNFDSTKDALAKSFLAELDLKVTDGAIARATASTGGVHLVWSKTLNSTAGRASWRREALRPASPPPDQQKQYAHHTTIELATKVLTDPARLRATLAHEFCHLATYIFSGPGVRPHGAEFKAWGARCAAACGVRVTTRHAYAVEWRYVWACAGPGGDGDAERDGVLVFDGGCGREFGRHGRSIDPARQRCAGCKGRLVQVRPVPRSDKGAGGGGVFAAFVKERFKGVKGEMGAGVKHGAVMEELGRRWKAEKEGRRGDGAARDDGDVDAMVQALEVVVIDD